MSQPGEAHHEQGAEGTRRAKRWLESTTRVEKAWTITDQVPVNRMGASWPFGGQTFTFDLGGMLSGEEFEGQMFLAEVKNYNSASDLGMHYHDWLAKCYVMLLDTPQLADQFMFITWHPFRQVAWRTLCSESAVREGLVHTRNRNRVFGVNDESEALARIQNNVVSQVADRLWLIVLSDKQERLVITRKHRSWIRAKEILEGG